MRRADAASPSECDECRAVPLSTLRDGTRAVVHQRLMACEDCELLNAMGLTERCRLQVCRRGEPCIVKVASTRLGLSAAMASRILVVPDEEAA
ncbi:MAG: FeoA family protein [Planctomycetota bacterium]